MAIDLPTELKRRQSASAAKAAHTKALKRALNCDVFIADAHDKQFIKPDVGVMLGFRALVQTAIPCPYCEEPMKEAVTTHPPHRIVKVLKRGKDFLTVMGHRIPLTHRTVACYGCKASFTVPRDREAATT